MLRRVALVRTDDSEELSASFIRVTRIGEIGTTLAVTSNRRTPRRKRYFLQEQQGLTSQKTQFIIDEDECGVTDGMNKWQEKQKYSKKTCHSASLSTTGPTHGLHPRSNPGRRGQKPATKRLN
jgi:hypothetical protein